MKKVNNFLIFAQNIDRGYTLERVPTIYVLEQNNSGTILLNVTCNSAAHDSEVHQHVLHHKCTVSL